MNDMDTKTKVDTESIARQLRRRLAAALSLDGQATERWSAAQTSLQCSPAWALREASRRRFSPELSYGRHFGPPLPTARLAAVMILLQPYEDTWAIPLTVRPNHLPDHPGQVCLPGGRLEPGETTQQAAEREFCEELGLERFPGHTVGTLQNIYVYNSDFYLTPLVAVTDRVPHYVGNPSEVESIVYLPIDHLSDINRHVVRGHARGSVSWTALGIECDSIHIWGATAIVLGELAALLNG